MKQTKVQKLKEISLINSKFILESKNPIHLENRIDRIILDSSIIMDEFRFSKAISLEVKKEEMYKLQYTIDYFKELNQILKAKRNVINSLHRNPKISETKFSQ